MTELFRAGDGSSLVVFRSDSRDVTRYRVFDSAWRATTPWLEADVQLYPARGIRHGFVGQAYRTARSGRSTYKQWVVIDAHGRLRPVPTASGRVSPRPGDVLLTSLPGRRYVYRAASGEVLPAARTSGFQRSTGWYPEPNGPVCAVPSPGRLGDPVLTSLDEGLSWLGLDTDVLPPESGPRLQHCLAQGDRVAVMTGGEYPRYLHTLDRSGALLSTLELQTDINGYDWTLLPDGSLVAGTNRPGLLVATDTTNRSLEFRPWPAGGWTEVLDDQLVLVHGRGLHVSDDRGRTWRAVDLGLPA